MGNHFRTSGDEQSAFTPPAPEAAAAPVGAVAQPDNQEQPLPLQEDLFSGRFRTAASRARARRRFRRRFGIRRRRDPVPGRRIQCAVSRRCARIFGHPVAGVHPDPRLRQPRLRPACPTSS